MTEFNEHLTKWFEEFQKIPPSCHLLCPKISDSDEENYRTLDNPTSGITLAEKEKRIQDGQRRIEITYWNSLIFGFDRYEAGNWLEDYAIRLQTCLKECPDCVFNWHSNRRAYLQKFSERWNEDSMIHIERILDKLDVKRIEESMAWAKKYVDKVEATGVTFKRSLLSPADQSLLLTAVYEALCCVPFFANPDKRTIFQYVFMRLQGRTYLKLGSNDPLPAMTFFLFDFSIEDRFRFATGNWKSVPADSMTELQFDWAVNGGLVRGIADAAKKDISQANSADSHEVQLFWNSINIILRAMTGDLILSRLRSLEVRPGSPSIYDLLFRHVQHCRSEGVLVATISVLTSLLKKAPKAIWDVIGDARPTVITDLIFGSPMYKDLLRQSLGDFWTGFEPSFHEALPFATSWIQPWLQSLNRDRRYDACDVFMHTLFKSLAEDKTIGEPGQAACIRAGFDALTFTLKSFLDDNVQMTSGSTHLYASSAVNLVVKYRGVILRNLKCPGVDNEGWTTLKVAQSAKDLILTAMRLDLKILSDEFYAIQDGKELHSAVVRDSKAYWDCVYEAFDASTERVGLAKDILPCLGPLISLEQFRPFKKVELDKSCKPFNDTFSGIAVVLARLLGVISDFDLTDLNVLFADRLPFQAIIGLSVNGEPDLAEASVSILTSWTGELSRHSALEHMARLHPEQTISSIVWTLDRIVRPPFPWGPIRPLLNTSRSVLQGLVDPTSGVLRTTTVEPKLAAIILRWWNEQWRFVSIGCLSIENWSRYITNAVMMEFCREIMDLADALVAEDGLLATTIAPGKSSKDAMAMILSPLKEHFRGMDNMIRLKDAWLVDKTVGVLCRILTRLRENGLEIGANSRRTITDACVPTRIPNKYLRSTNLNDQQRAELLRALGHQEGVEIVQVDVMPEKAYGVTPKAKTQSKLDVWSKSASGTSAGPKSKSNRDDVMELSRSVDSPVLKQIEARRAKAPRPAKGPDAKAISALKESRRREKAEKAKRDAETIARARQLRGETGRSRSDIMVNSSDEESDADSDGTDAGGQLAALGAGGQKAQDEESARLQQALRDQLRRPVKKDRLVRSVNQMKARLAPRLDELHTTILMWDPFHEGNDPPGLPPASRVATQYSDPRSYRSTFFPLLVSEGWRSFVTSMNELTSQPFAMNIASRATVDSFLEVTFTLPMAPNKERLVSEGDIILVSQAGNPLAEKEARHCLGRIHRITYKKGILEVTYRVASRSNALTPLLVPGSGLHGIKITNMTTIEREFGALESLQHYDLMHEILKGEPSPILRYAEEKITSAMQNWSLNRGQALAVLGANDNDGFTLIQGPPGTGKTKTIVAMVGSLLSDQLSQTSSGMPVGGPSRPANAVQGQGSGRPKKMLVCAPSNAAADELVLRLKAGIRTKNGKSRTINVLRLGRSDAINAAVKDVTLDELVRKRLEGDTTREDARAHRDKLHEEAADIKERLEVLRQRLEEARGKCDHVWVNNYTRQVEDLKRTRANIGRQIEANKDSGDSLAREMEMRRRQVQQEVLNSAHVLCATLSGSGHEMFRSLDVEFETVIIDEAAQCVELSALIPLRRCYKCVLVATQQLPPTVLSQSAARFGYDQSLFVRMQQNHPDSVHMLDTQYRMHPDISLFPSAEFYEGQVSNGPGMARLRRQPWHGSALLGPYRFFDVQGVQEKGRRGQSLVNTRELEVAMALYESLEEKYRGCKLGGKIGIITPYKAQLMELRSRFRARFGDDITDDIDFNTTDAFQGRECEIIIFSCVRASATGGIGFMTDIRRMNVGLTRAKSSLWILGDSRALVQGEFWQKLIEDAKARDRYTCGDVLGMFRRPLEPAKIQEVIDDEEEEASKAAAAATTTTTTTTTPPPPPPPPPPKAEAKALPATTTNNDDNNNSSDQAGRVTSRPGEGPPVIHTGPVPGPGDGSSKKRSLENAPLPAPKRVGDIMTMSGRGFWWRTGCQVWTATNTEQAAAKGPFGDVGAGLDASGAAAGADDSFSGSRSGSWTGSWADDDVIDSTDDDAGEQSASRPPLKRKKPKPSLFMPKKR
ncbi:hypothetical protein L249_8302 [Ophiocordyceps polyrhachis-furcata BCC 54312]|uniref:AAA+ ATPase domain-containing protein n=1 Tax=Ophiocordyceps polyrhachis-furcata BCC 54312 TaxID=1330021 RepID=A0A367LHV7_9HYPO|nr:hypothetical protein L249_8302 [Ophiocordyceps polyrhachis-furcata BCC 54312]